MLGLTNSPLYNTLPFSTANLANALVLKNLAAQSHLSSLTFKSRVDPC